MNRSKIVRLIENRKDGFTNKEIASRLGVHHRTITYWFRRLKDEGYEIPPRNYKGGRKKLKL